METMNVYFDPPDTRKSFGALTSLTELDCGRLRQIYTCTLDSKPSQVLVDTATHNFMDPALQRLVGFTLPLKMALSIAGEILLLQSLVVADHY